MLRLVVRVDALGRLWRGVPEDVLYLGQVRAAIEQHARLGVAKVVRRRRHAYRARVALDDAPHRLRRQPPLLTAVPGAASTMVVMPQEDRRQRVVARRQVLAD